MTSATGQGDGRVYRASIASAAIAAAFCATVAAAMVLDELRLRRVDIENAPELVSIRQAMQVSPASDLLKLEYRKADQRVRQQFIAAQTRIDTGRYLLAAALAAMLVAAGMAVAARRRPFLPGRAGVRRSRRPAKG